MTTRFIRAEDLAFMLSSSRISANKSQKYMAKHLGKSVGTIQNWEAGIGAPNIIDTLDWFEILGINPLRYILEFVHPDVYKGINPSSSDESIKSALLFYFQNIATNEEIRKLSYSIFGNTGSSWNAQLDMLTAHNHTSMRSRVNVAQTIMDSYDMEKARNELIGTNHIMPNEAHLRNAIINGKKAVFKGCSGYTNNNNRDKQSINSNSSYTD